jgi:hypothetical protein
VRRRARRGLVAAAVVLVAVPFVTALVVVHEPRWYPSLEHAETELHVRDVGTTHTPLTGLIGRLGAVGERGSHPGPTSFYALAPVYRLAGSTPWALQVSTVVLHLSAVGAALWIAHRRGGLRLVLLVGGVLVVLLRFYGAGLLTEPWNPYLPMVWWVVFLLAVWSVVMRDTALLPVVVVAGTLCVQTHISYLGLVGGLTALAAATVVVRSIAHRRRGAPPAGTSTWVVLSVIAGAVLWFPPVLDELLRRPGNLRVLLDTFTASEEATIGPVQAVRLLLSYLDPWRLLVRQAEGKIVTEPPVWPVAGLLFVSAWGASAFVAWRLKHRALLHLDAVLGVALVLGAISLSRIFGDTWAWLVQWAWGLTALMVVTIAWTLGALVEHRVRGPRLRFVRVAAAGALAVVAVCSAVALTVDAADVEPDAVAFSRALRHHVPATVEALQADRDRSGGRYLVTNIDPMGVVGEFVAFGLVNELDRAGVPVGVEPGKRLRAAPYLTLDPPAARAVVRVITGSAIEEWDRKAGARRLTMFDPRTDEERALQERLRREIDDELRRLGREDMAQLADSSFMGALFLLHEDDRVPRGIITKMTRVYELGTPSAVFVGG